MSEVSTSEDKKRDFTGLNLNLPRFNQPEFMRDKATGSHRYLGLPYRGDPQPFKNNDPEYKKPQYHFDVHIEVLDTSDEEQLKRWTEIGQMIADGLAFPSFEERQWEPESKSWKILIRWCEPHYDAPTEEPAI